jgi:hypothetical protein
VLPGSSTRTPIGLARTVLNPQHHGTPVVDEAAVRRVTVLPELRDHGVRAGPERERFEALGVLGEGGMAQVQLVRDLDIGRTIAIKRLAANAQPSMVQRFVEEIRTIGTPFYLSPEQARGENAGLDQRSDAYALGVVFHELQLWNDPSTSATIVRGVGLKLRPNVPFIGQQGLCQTEFTS